MALINWNLNSKTKLLVREQQFRFHHLKKRPTTPFCFTNKVYNTNNTETQKSNQSNVLNVHHFKAVEKKKICRTKQKTFKLYTEITFVRDCFLPTKTRKRNRKCVCLC